MSRPFLDFYTKLDVIPTHQDISDLQNHFNRRHGLYIQLGVPPLFIRNCSVLEFGPGTGQNAIVTASSGPSEYVLVDGNSKSIETTTETLRPFFDKVPIQIIKDDILTYTSDKKFDLVLCEGLIPVQLDPSGFLKHVASFANKGGVVVITCMDSVSVLSEALRRYLCYYECSPATEVKERIAKLTVFLKPHFEKLPGMSRRHEDWVIDNIIHPWAGSLLSVSEAIQTLAGEFVVLGSNPHFMSDWRWYKNIVGEEVASVSRAENSYWRNLHSFLDFRAVFGERDVEVNKKFFAYADKIYQKIMEQDKQNVLYPMAELAADLTELKALLNEPSSRTSLALEEVIQALTTYQGTWPDFPEFGALWGRGQQYISFMKL
ncbi:hypothetical protein DB346_07470 [Verrucomicrobia bacterium LW23]|nr:hypothetical protein DB346_07470 [Verrucomicrobia bacterium LW23]